ncbi:outer membrane lipoprotein carrier protein LolA [Zunongwangia sp. F363]|uniref:Outer membrane lipoprotein carrier protein LolA n=1 Tax=Autumnicola tepida TaxID=3075595 RepID=A0ABU3C6C4_9FLAO|nr:outer membrane lipoprotein carrier protein LolA [Zunongwangia sp. F363]MDT0641880.1 outer membrane lipoprotein carrier protein LolA [Zunongwangia sp. F363]
MSAQDNRLNQAEKEKFQREVASQAKNLETLQADFVQTKHIEMITADTRSKGQIFFRSPDIIKWHYSEPFQYTVLFRDGKLYINDDGSKSITEASGNKLYGKMITMISETMNGKLLGKTENFEVVYFRENEQICASLKPKDEDILQMFSKILMRFNNQYLIQSVKLIDEGGDSTEIYLRNVQMNQPLENSVFQH